MSGRGRSWGCVLGVRRLLPLLDLLHQRPLAHRLLLLVCPTVDRTGTVRLHQAQVLLVPTAIYWFLLYWQLLLQSLYCGTKIPNHQNPPQAAGPGLPPSCLFRCGQNRESVTRQELLTVHGKESKDEKYERTRRKKKKKFSRGLPAAWAASWLEVTC